MMVGVILVLSMLGMLISASVTTHQETHLDQLDLEHATYVNQAGLEYAMRLIYEGRSPVVVEPGLDFSGGIFSIARQDKTVTVTAKHGPSEVVRSVTSPSMADCTVFDFGMADLSQNGLWINKIQFRKICLEQTILDKISVLWNDPGTEGMNKMKVENDVLYDDIPILSGGVTELVDYYAMTNNYMNNINEIRFSDDMNGKNFTMTFVFKDNSSSSYDFIP